VHISFSRCRCELRHLEKEMRAAEKQQAQNSTSSWSLISIILQQARGYCYFVVARYVFPRTELTFPLFSSGSEYSPFPTNALLVVLLKPVDVFLVLRYLRTDSFSRTTLAERGRLDLRLSFPETLRSMQSKDFSTAKTEFGNIQRNRYDDT